jgi:hypothetical protein
VDENTTATPIYEIDVKQMRYRHAGLSNTNTSDENQNKEKQQIWTEEK